MNAELVVVGDVVIGNDGLPMKVLDVEHLYEPDGCKVRQVLITLKTEEQPKPHRFVRFGFDEWGNCYVEPVDCEVKS